MSQPRVLPRGTHTASPIVWSGGLDRARRLLFVAPSLYLGLSPGRRMSVRMDFVPDECDYGDGLGILAATARRVIADCDCKSDVIPQ